MAKTQRDRLMSFSTRSATATVGLLLLGGMSSVLGQTPDEAAPPPPPRTVEPGLEEAQKWVWRVMPPSDEGWGRLVAAAQPDASLPRIHSTEGGTAPGQVKLVAPEAPRPQEYTVERGDALHKIARKFGMTADQLKAANGLTSDVIRIGQVLKIPTLEELRTLLPPPPPKPVAQNKPAPPPPISPGMGLAGQLEQVNVLLQVYMDREGFSCGYIDGKAGPVFQRVLDLFLATRDGVPDQLALLERARTVLGSPYTTYQLRPDDMRFIMQGPATPARAVRRGAKTASPTPTEPELTYRDLVAPPLLLYRSVWEFVAEKFHCDEAFLRRLNPKIKGEPLIGTALKVPNVFPFEIEHLTDSNLQPLPDPAEPVTASVIGLTRMQIYKGGKLVAVMPVASARPGLRGRNIWTVLDAIPAPRLATNGELRDPPKAPMSPILGEEEEAAPAAAPASPPVAKAVLEGDQYLGSGPNNPVGVVWINLARGKSAEPLPYGLHGTSIPGKMNTQAGLGGFRMTNWDIARAVRLLPAGTQIEWKEN